MRGGADRKREARFKDSECLSIAAAFRSKCSAPVLAQQVEGLPIEDRIKPGRLQLGGIDWCVIRIGAELASSVME